MLGKNCQNPPVLSYPRSQSCSWIGTIGTGHSAMVISVCTLDAWLVMLQPVTRSHIWQPQLYGRSMVTRNGNTLW